MQIKYLSNGLKLNDQEKEYLVEKATRIEKFLADQAAGADDELRLEVEVDQDKKGFWRIELMVKTPRQLFRASKTRESFTEAVDVCKEALMKQARREKERLEKRNRQS